MITTNQSFMYVDETAYIPILNAVCIYFSQIAMQYTHVA